MEKLQQDNVGCSLHRYAQLQQAFALAIHGVLTSTTRQEFLSCFPQFTAGEQEKLYAIFTRVVAKIHQDAVTEFNLQCDAAEVKDALSEMEQLIQQQLQHADYHHDSSGFKSSRSRVFFPGKAVQDLVMHLKREEVEKLKASVPHEEEKNAQLSLQLEAYRKQAVAAQDPASVAAIFAKVREARAKLEISASAIHGV